MARNSYAANIWLKWDTLVNFPLKYRYIKKSLNVYQLNEYAAHLSGADTSILLVIFFV